MADTVVDMAAIYHAPSLLMVSPSRVVHISKDNVIENRTVDQTHKSFVTIMTLSRPAGHKAFSDKPQTSGAAFV